MSAAAVANVLERKDRLEDEFSVPIDASGFRLDEEGVVPKPCTD